MPIDLSLLVKAAKVYEASEAVDGMKPREVYESHKKCAPGEFGLNKEGADPRMPTDIGGVSAMTADDETDLKDLNNQAEMARRSSIMFGGQSLADSYRAQADRLRNRVAERYEDRSARGLRDAGYALRYPRGPVADAERALNSAKNEQSWTKDDLSDFRSADRAALGVTTAANAVAPMFGRTAQNVARAGHNFVSGVNAAGSLYHHPREEQLAQHNVNQAQRQLDYAKNPWERNPGNVAAGGRPAPQPFKATGIPGFVDRISQQIGNIKLPSARETFRATHPSISRPFDTDFDAPAPAAKPAPVVNTVKKSGFFDAPTEPNIFEEVAADDAFRRTHPIASQSYDAARRAGRDFSKTWNPASFGRAAYHTWMGGMQHDGETLGTAYGNLRNNVRSAMKGPSAISKLQGPGVSAATQGVSAVAKKPPVSMNSTFNAFGK